MGGINRKDPVAVVAVAGILHLVCPEFGVFEVGFEVGHEVVGVVHDEEGEQVVVQTLLEALQHAQVVRLLHALLVLVLQHLQQTHIPIKNKTPAEHLDIFR